jgi:hypothetical protein
MSSSPELQFGSPGVGDDDDFVYLPSGIIPLFRMISWPFLEKVKSMNFFTSPAGIPLVT